MAMKHTRKLSEADVRKMANEYAECELQIVANNATTDVLKDQLDADCDEQNAPHLARQAELWPDVQAFLLARKADMCSKRKKTIDTTRAKFGFRLVANVEEDDPKAIVKHARAHGMDDVFTDQAPKINKPAIKKRIKAGEKIPGARLLEDYEPFVKPQKTLVDKAKRGEA